MARKLHLHEIRRRKSPPSRKATDGRGEGGQKFLSDFVQETQSLHAIDRSASKIAFLVIFYYY